MYDELELDLVGDRKTALFFIISDTDATFNFLVSMAYTQLFNLLCERADDKYGGRLPVHVRCLIDEAANIGQIPNLEKLMATIRSREISACLVLQAQSQLKALYKDNMDTIIGNCDAFLTANDQESDQIRGYEVGAVDYITKPFVIGALQRKIKAMFAMLEHHKPAKDIYDDGRLFLDFSEQAASLKSTLLHMMGGLDTPTSGNVIVRDKELSKMNDEQLTIFRRRNIGFIFQNYNLVPILNVYENIVLPVELDGDTVDQKFLDEIVHLLGLEDKLKNMPNNLSGGQQQRVAIARALITKPAIVLADEPTGNLDSKTSAEVLGLIKRTSAEFRQTVVMITHNNDIARLADRIVRIEDGKIVE